MRRSILFLATCVITAGCSNRSESGPPAGPGDTIQVYEAVFRYRLQKQPSDVRAYLSVDGQDPPADLLTRLRCDWPNLKPASKELKKKGLRVYVEGLNWINPVTAELKAGQWFPTKFGGEGYFADHRVVCDGEKWVVETVTNETMS
jgi:hypothetical protein